MIGRRSKKRQDSPHKLDCEFDFSLRRDVHGGLGAIGKTICLSLRSEIESALAATGLEYEDVVFATHDGLTLYGWFVPSAVDQETSMDQT